MNFLCNHEIGDDKCFIFMIAEGVGKTSFYLFHIEPGPGAKISLPLMSALLCKKIKKNLWFWIGCSSAFKRLFSFLVLIEVMDIKRNRVSAPMVRYLDSVQNEHNMRLASFFFNQEHYVLVLAYDRNVIQGSREHEVIKNWIIIRAKKYFIRNPTFGYSISWSQ